MRAEPAAPEVIRKAFGNFGYWQAAGIRGRNCARFTNSFNFLQQTALDFEIFDYGLDDPVHLCKFLQIVFKIADRNQPGKRRFEKSCGP